MIDVLLENDWDVSSIDRGGRKFIDLPPEVRLYEQEISNRGMLREALQGVDTVFHLAWSGVHVSSNQDLRNHVDLNLHTSLALFEACSDAGVRRVVFISSGGTVYGPTSALKIEETHPTHPISGYGVTKLATEHYLAVHARLRGLEHVILRPSVAYGERQHPDGLQGAVAVFMGRVLREQPIVIWGDGSTIRDFFYARDLAEACLPAATADVDGETFNIGSGAGISLTDLIAEIRDVSGREPQVTYEPARDVDVPHMVLDIEKACSLLDWTPRTPFKDGLERVHAWLSKVL